MELYWEKLGKIERKNFKIVFLILFLSGLLIISFLLYDYQKELNFNKKSGNISKKIPIGTVKSYSEVAKAIGKPRAIRAVANAIAKNPYP